MSDTLTVAHEAPATGPLTIDQAVDIQLARKAAPAPKKTKAPEAAPVEPEPEIVTEDPPESVDQVDEDSDAAPQAAEDGDEAPETDTLDVDEAQGDDPAPPTLDPPARWDAKGKALFATLTREAQETILDREKLQQAEVTKAQQKSAEVAKTFETRIQHLNAVAEQIGAYVDQGEANVKAWDERMSEWDTWWSSEKPAELSESNPAAYQKQEALYRQEQADARKAKAALDKARADKAQATETASRAFGARQEELISGLVPELASSHADVMANRKALHDYLVSIGEGKAFTSEAIGSISAYQAQLAWKARALDALGDISALKRDAEAYRKAKAVTDKAAAAPKPPQPKAGPTPPQGSAGNRPSSSEARFKALIAKKSLTLDEASERAELRRKLRK